MAAISSTLPLPAKVFGSGLWRRPPTSANNDATGRFGQQAHFLELIREIRLAEIELNDHRTLAGGGSFIHGDSGVGKDRPAGPAGPSGDRAIIRRLFLLEADRT